jgi:hypothetical protein
MENSTKEQIVHRAFELWEQNDKPEGRNDEFYHQADKELKQGVISEEKSETFLE